VHQNQRNVIITKKKTETNDDKPLTPEESDLEDDELICANNKNIEEAS